SLKSNPDAFIVQVPSQLIDGVPANVPRALLPEYITNLILSRCRPLGESGTFGFSDLGAFPADPKTDRNRRSTSDPRRLSIIRIGCADC
ncbi:hypothetical protein PQQ96_32915, partial [Paraburkholderia sediminicola]|uniref:hypothetical protein n=1 Tax=Paraburkholderia sediminicola TaxID=458836 RepID=UPI0038BAEF00